MKFVIGGSTVLATVLLTASFVFYTPTKTIALSQSKQENKQEQKQEDKNSVKKQDTNKQEDKNAKVKNKTDEKATKEIIEGIKSEHYSATAYALKGRTATGRGVSRGIIAADPRVLPLGSRVRVEAGNWSGEYLVADTGGKVKGKKIDIWVPNNGEARRFGRRTVKLTVLSYGGKRAKGIEPKVTEPKATQKKK